MTKDQTEALNRVKANWAHSNDNESPVYSYKTNDISVVLCLLADQADTLKCVKEDLEKLCGYLLIYQVNGPYVDMINSTLSLLESEA